MCSCWKLDLLFLPRPFGNTTESPFSSNTTMGWLLQEGALVALWYASVQNVHEGRVFGGSDTITYNGYFSRALLMLTSRTKAIVINLLQASSLFSWRWFMEWENKSIWQPKLSPATKICIFNIFPTHTEKADLRRVSIWRSGSIQHALRFHWSGSNNSGQTFFQTKFSFHKENYGRYSPRTKWISPSWTFTRNDNRR